MVVVAELHLAGPVFLCVFHIVVLLWRSALPTKRQTIFILLASFFTSRNIRKCCAAHHFFIFCFELDFLVIFKVVLRSSPPGFLKVSVFL